uniref:Apple domain-containing protein n=1 Tax=Haemonchus contortus TaxID=6289 RepID=A0A7I4YGC0_HAECO
MFSAITLLLLAFTCDYIYGNYLDINECFVELPNFQLTVDSMAVESVEFKDDCLRACLRSFLRGKPCAGAEHRPKDNACVLSEKTGERRLNNEPKTGSYFENVCARPQEGGRLEARLTGYRGGEGILEMAQRKGQNPKLLAIMTGLQENRNFHLIYAPDVELTSCYKAGLLKDHKGKKLITIDSDSRGMAIQPWTEVDFHILDDAVIDKVILVVEAGTSNVVDCGKLQIHGNVSDWQRAMNGSPSTLRVTVTYFVALLVALLIFA